jgi:hypothetical protein
MLQQHENQIKNKLVDHNLMREMIKNYIHDYDIQLKHDLASSIEPL